jgi:hypothetical protein
MPPRPQVLNDVFQQAVEQAKQKLPNLTQNQQVCFKVINRNMETKCCRLILWFYPSSPNNTIGCSLVPQFLKDHE